MYFHAIHVCRLNDMNRSHWQSAPAPFPHSSSAYITHSQLRLKNGLQWKAKIPNEDEWTVTRRRTDEETFRKKQSSEIPHQLTGTGWDFNQWLLEKWMVDRENQYRHKPQSRTNYIQTRAAFKGSSFSHCWWWLLSRYYSIWTQEVLTIIGNLCKC